MNYANPKGILHIVATRHLLFNQNVLNPLQPIYACLACWCLSNIYWQGSNLMAARLPHVTKTDDRRMKTHSKVAHLATDFIF